MARILVIEDNDQARTVMAASLRHFGHTVVEARNGTEGLASHAQAAGSFDLVICDLFMSEGGGIETIRTMRHRDPQVPILAVSGGRNALDYVSSQFECTRLRSLRKPFSVQTLVGSVDGLLAG